MSGSYRKNKGFFSILFRDKGFYTILTVSILAVCLAAYFAVSYGNTPTETVSNPTNAVVENDKNYKPNWIKDKPSFDASVGHKVEGVTESPTELPTEPATDTPKSVVFAIPINMDRVTTINVFSGTTPVFSETLNDWRLHQGMDFLTVDEEDVFASAEGTVEDVYEDALMGYSVLIRHADNSLSLYQSLSTVRVNKGAEVSADTIIGKTGKTADAEESVGNHVHFSVIKDGKYVDPNDLFPNN